MKRLMILVLLTLVSVGLKAQEVKVVFSEFVGGTVEATAYNGQKVIITVTPSEGYFIEKTDMEVIAVVDPAAATRASDTALPVASALELTLVDAEGKAITDGKGGAVSDPEDLTEARCYMFEVPEGLGAWVRTANFHEVVGTHLEIDEKTTELDAKLLSEYPNLKSITIKNADQVIGLGGCDVSGLTVDVPGNLYNEYLTTEGWDKAEIISTTGVEMTGVAFGENNSYDTFVSSVAVRIPSVLNGFVISAIKDDVVIIEEITDGIIPAGVPVLLLSKAHKGKDFRTAPTDKDGGDYKNILKAAGEGGQEVKLGEVYLLYNDVFYLSQAGTIPEGGVYLPKPVLKTRAFLSIGDSADDTTAIEGSMFNVQCSMFNDSWYDLNGRRLNGKPTAKGIYVNNGRKVMVR